VKKVVRLTHKFDIFPILHIHIIDVLRQRVRRAATLISALVALTSRLGHTEGEKVRKVFKERTE